eukprot:3719741-Heterocapsa_arctica.AAC.1
MGDEFVLQKIWWRLDWIGDNGRRRRGGRMCEGVPGKSSTGLPRNQVVPVARPPDGLPGAPAPGPGRTPKGVKTQRRSARLVRERGETTEK